MNSNPVPTKISDEAIEWYSKLNSGRVLPEDYKLFELWRRQSPVHEQAFADIEKLSLLLDEPARRVFAKERVDSRSVSTRKNRRRPWVLAGLSVVAASMIILWLPAMLSFWGADYATGWGERREVVLADGSIITLNTHSAVSVDFSSGRREVSLISGEVYFQVAHDAYRPFIVDTQYGHVKVTGTAFNVYAQKKRMTVTVSEGRVFVYAVGSEDSAVELIAGLQTTGDANGIAKAVTADAQQVAAWRNGLLVFTMQPLSAVVDDLNRYFHGRIVIVDPSIRHKLVSGVFDLEHPKNVLAAIEKTLDLKTINFSNTFFLLYK